MQRNLGARTVNTVNFSGNSKIAAEGAIAFDSENSGKNTKIDFIYKLKGFLFFRGVTSSTYGLTYARSGGKR